MIFAIRDDDTSFFTKKEDLEKAYDFIKAGAISLSVVPSTVSVHRDDVFPYGKDIPYGYYDIEGNRGLINYLNANNEKYDILLHGYSHEYKMINEKWVAEMVWKPVEQLNSEIKEGKNRLESLFGRKISVFVAPNNSINQNAIGVLEELGMDYSGIILHHDRKVTTRYLANYLRRWGTRFTKRIPYPGILDYGKHKELVAYTLDNFQRLKCEYMECKKRKQPFVLYTHYWQLNENPKTKQLLEEIYKYMIDDGAQLVALSECFGKER